jgi:UDP-N-acetylglucosamine:LPS N-acetylglucosamine transferase
VSKPAVIMVTSNGVGAGHLIRASAIARELHKDARPIIFSMAYSVVEVASALNLECEYVPGRDKGLMVKKKWDRYLRDRLVALIDETDAKVVTFDGVVPYAGIVAAKFARPHINLVWIRRGMWQRKPQGVLLGLQSKLMDYVIEPGDVARDADSGPTKSRAEALLMKPVSLYDQSKAFSRHKACEVMGVNPEKPVVLVQMGIGNTDLNQRISAVFKGLASWSDVQIVMAREPKDENGKSLLPENMTVTVIRHFPLADLLHGFDAAICAAGYNSVHENIPAGLPTLFIPNNRGTDDQRARAMWCADNGLALYADNDSLEEIEHQSAKLAFPLLRQQLISQCQQVTLFSGASDIAELIRFMTHDSYSALVNKRVHFQRFIAIAAYARGPQFYARRIINASLRFLAVTFRALFPHNDLELPKEEAIFSESRNFKLLDKYIRGQERFEHVLSDASPMYIAKRKQIAKNAYGELEITPISHRTEIETFLRYAS